MGDAAKEAYEKLLVADLARVVDWLKFSETKNGALLGFSSGWAIAAGNMLIKVPFPTPIFAGVIPYATTLFTLAAVRLIWSFMPSISIKAFLGGNNTDLSNFLFFGDVAKVPIGEFSDRIRSRYFPTAPLIQTDDYLRDLEMQLHINSTIALRKFKAFRTGAALTVGGIVAFALPVCWHFLATLVDYLSCR